MQDDGQLVLLRELELGFVKALLLGQCFGGVEFGHKTIEANFTHSHQTWVVAVGVQRGIELCQMRLGGLGGVERVNAQRIRVLLGVGQQAHGVKVGSFYGGNHTGRHACCTCTHVHVSSVGVKLGRIEVAMCVNPHRVWCGLHAAQRKHRVGSSGGDRGLWFLGKHATLGRVVGGHLPCFGKLVRNQAVQADGLHVVFHFLVQV